MSTGFAPQQQFQPQAPQMQPNAAPAPAQQPGETQMPTNVGQRQGYPQWGDQSAQMAQRVQQPAQMLPPQQPQGMPQYVQQPQMQAPPQYAPQPQQFPGQQMVAPQQPAFPQQQPMQAPQQRPLQVPFSMGPDPSQQGPAGPYQFNDGLNLAGPVGGGQVPMQQAPQQFQAPGQQQMVPVPSPIRDNLVAQGVPVGHYANDQQLLSDLGGAASEIQQLRHFARMGMMQQRGLPTDGQQQQAGQQQAPPNGQQQQAPGQQQQPQRPRAPEWRDEWQSLVRLDPATGQYKAVDPMAVNPAIVERANEFAAYRRRQIDSLATDPAKAVWDGGMSELVAAEVDRRMQAADQQRQAQMQEIESQRAFDSFLQQNQQQFFQIGNNGQPIVNPYTGEPTLTPRGQSFRQHAARFNAEFSARYGRMPDARDTITFVQGALVQEDWQRAAQGQQLPPGFAPQQYQQAPQLPWQQPQPYQQVAGGYGPLNQNAAMLEQTVQQALQRAQQSPNQNGTEVSQQLNGVPQNGQLNFRQLLQQAAAQRGLA